MAVAARLLAICAFRHNKTALVACCAPRWLFTAGDPLTNLSVLDLDRFSLNPFDSLTVYAGNTTSGPVLADLRFPASRASSTPPLTLAAPGSILVVLVAGQLVTGPPDTSAGYIDGAARSFERGKEHYLPVPPLRRAASPCGLGTPRCDSDVCIRAGVACPASPVEVVSGQIARSGPYAASQTCRYVPPPQVARALGRRRATSPHLYPVGALGLSRRWLVSSITAYPASVSGSGLTALGPNDTLEFYSPFPSGSGTFLVHSFTGPQSVSSFSVQAVASQLQVVLTASTINYNPSRGLSLSADYVNPSTLGGLGLG